MTTNLEAAAHAAAQREQRIQNVVDAIDAFVQAKIVLEHRLTSSGPGRPAARLDVEETREHMRDKLAELIEGRG